MAIMTRHNAAVKEMEAAAIAWVAGLFRKPMFCVKAVTDIVDGGRPTQVRGVMRCVRPPARPRSVRAPLRMR